MRPDKSIRQIGFQESDMVGLMSTVTKYSVMVSKPEDIRYELEKCIHIMKSGRPGPVHLDIPIDIAKSMIDPDALLPYDETIKMSFDEDAINKQIDLFIDDLMKSERPALMIGGGVRLSGAEKDILELGNKLKIPIFPTWNALDIICSDYAYYGAREAKKYMVDVDAPGLQKKLQQVPFDVCIYSDAKLFIKLLMKRLDEVPDFTEWMNRCEYWKNKYDPVTPEMFEEAKHVNQYAFTRMLSEEMGSDDILVGDCGGNIVVINHSFKTKTGQRYFTNNGNSPMGFSFAGAIGAWFASDKENQNVVCIIGDGGMNMNIQELQTLVNYNVGVKVIILNNHIYGITKAFQETNFEGRMEACGPIGYNPPDFIKIAEAYQLDTMKIEGTDYEKIRQQIREMLSHDGPLIVDVNCHEQHTYEPKLIGWETPIEDMYPYLPREEFLENMIIEPLEISLNPDRLVYPTIVGTETME
jgi:acetolactate synthase-1/2/3 large subunit